METVDYGLISELVLQNTHPVYVVNEATEEIVFTNKRLDDMMGCSLVGENCLEAFFGDRKMGAIVPASREPGESYQWDYADKKAGKLFKILDLWYEDKGRRYRIGVITDTSDLMDLNRSLADYLWLMQEISGLQVKMTMEKENVLPVLLTFFSNHYKAARVVLSYFEEARPVTYIAEGEKLQRLDTFFDSTQPQYVFQVGTLSFSLWMEDIQNSQAWEEDRDFVLSVASVYIENSILWQKLKWENSHDLLTGLYTRSKLNELAKERFENDDSLGIIYMDVFGTRSTNECYGYEAGDELLKRMAEVLKVVTNEQVHAFRMGGDEFVLVCENYAQERLQSLEGAIMTMIEDVNKVNPSPRLSVACGLAAGQGSVTFEALMTTANKRMQKVKKQQ